MRKKIKSRLDPHLDTLLEMDDQKKTLDEMLAWLREQGVDYAKPALSKILHSHRQRRLNDRFLDDLKSGAQQCKALAKQFAQDPPADLDFLVLLQRHLIFNLSKDSASDPEMMRLAQHGLHLIMEDVNAQTRARQRDTALDQAERKLKILEDKAAQADAAKTVVESKLTPEQKEAEYRRIFGMA